MSVRKSLQGLNYYATEGTRVFEDLMLLLEKLNKWEIDMEGGNKNDRVP